MTTNYIKQIEHNMNILNYNDFESIYANLNIDEILFEYKKIIYNAYKQNNNASLVMPLFWQDYYSLLYLSLKFVANNYESNSCIISLGESPHKLLFTVA